MTDWPEWTAGWTPPVETETLAVGTAAVAGLAALLDADPVTVADGHPLPILWHWAALAHWQPMALTGPDGHPPPGDLMPPSPYPRRMWLGTTVTASEAPTVGSPVVVERSTVDVTEKSGGTGTFALVTVRTTVRSVDARELVVEDTQFAYRPTPDAGAPRPTPAAMPVEPGSWLARQDAGWLLRPNPVVLARFSALTANGHRIHYDVPYATQVEGYPNVLVHGPLMAVVLAEVARRDHPQREVATFSCRARRPYFLGTAAVVRRGDSRDSEVDLELVGDGEDSPYMTATVGLR